MLLSNHQLWSEYKLELLPLSYLDHFEFDRDSKNLISLLTINNRFTPYEFGTWDPTVSPARKHNLK